MTRQYLKTVVFLLFLFHVTPSYTQWIRQYPLAKLENVVDMAVYQDGQGYAVGADDLILRLDPGSKKWNLLTTWDGGWTLEAVDYLEGTSGNIVAAGGQGLILSTNGGTNWNEIPNAPAGIVAIKVLSATDILVIAVTGVFQWTNNTWNNRNLPVSAGIHDGFILDSDHIWCFSNGATPVIYSTSNGGANWTMNSQIDRPDVITFYDTQTGVALDGRTVFSSNNGGQTWTEVSNNAIHNSSNDITFGSSANVLMAATLNGVPTLSTDGGVTWTQKDPGMINVRSYSIAATSDLEFWVGNDLSSISLTTDAGDTWTETSGPDRQIMNDVFFVTRNIGFACGTGGTLLRTSNAGSNWEDISFGETRAFYCLSGLTANDMWLGANLRIYHSGDMGASWQEKATTLGGNMIDIHAVSADIVLACSSSGFIFRTDDGGSSWDTVYQTSTQIRSITKIDNQRYLATGFNGLILRSTDQGLTWNVLGAPEPGLQYEKAQFDGEEGWLVTSSFEKTMWHTTNAGDTWNPITLPIERFWEGTYFITPDTGIVVGRSNAEGRVYITFNGGTNWQPGYITDFPLYGVTGFANPNGTAWIFGFGSDIEILPYCTMLPLISNLTGENAPCENDTVTYTISTQDVEQLFWLFPTGWQIQGDPNNDTIRVRVGRNSGPVSVTGSNSCGFTSPITISATPTLLPQVTNITGNLAPCEEDLQTYSAISSDVTDFAWTFPGADWEVVGEINTDQIMVLVGTTSGSVQVMGSNVCGEKEFQKAVTAAFRPQVDFVSGNQVPCWGDHVQYTANGQYFDEVIWTYPGDWMAGAQTQTTIDLIIGETPGEVTAQGFNPCGGSTIRQLEVFPLASPTITTIVNGNELTLSGTGIAYQWYLNGEIIEGATEDSYTAVESGDYFASIQFDNGCLTTSEPVNVIITSLETGSQILPLTVYPSPAKDMLQLKGVDGPFTFMILDVTGKIMTEQSSNDVYISLQSLADGLYFLKLQQNQKTYLTRFVVMK